MADMLLFSALLLLAFVSLSVIAEDNNEQPSTELLEFLGEWETRDGEWFNPLWILKNLRDDVTGSNANSSGEREVKEDE